MISAGCYCHILSFLLFIVFNWNASIFLASKFSVHSFGYFSRETSRGSVRPIKTVDNSYMISIVYRYIHSYLLN